MKQILAIGLLLVAMVGCATVPQGTAPSASPLVDPEGSPQTYEVVGRSEGSAGSFSLFGFIPFGRPDIDAAVQEAMNQLGGDNLINVRYYVSGAYYLVGFSTSITVEGDVVRYRNGAKETTPITALVRTRVKPGMIHRLNLGSVVDGLSADYTFNQGLSKVAFVSFGVGYKRHEETVSVTSFGYPFEFKEKYNALPVMLNFGINGKKLLNNGLAPYASAGAAYIPIFEESEFEWSQVGFNLNAGLDYELGSGFALGVDYRYVKSLRDFDQSFTVPAFEKVEFSNLCLTLAFYI